MTFSKKTITPSLAREWLNHDGAKRSLSSQTVTLYAKTMKAGRWGLSPQPIVRNGTRLLDGHHRLTAVIESDCSVEFWVCEGADEDVIRYVDRGRPRTAANTLQLYYGVQSATRVVSAARVINMLDRGGNAFTKLADWEVEELRVRYRNEIEWVLSKRTQRHFATATFLAPLSWVLPLYPDEVETFYQGVMTGAGLSSRSAELRLRDRLIESGANQRSHMAKEHVILLVLAALRAAVDGEEISQLKATTAPLERFWKERNGRTRWTVPAWAKGFRITKRRPEGGDDGEGGAS